MDTFIKIEKRYIKGVTFPVEEIHSGVNFIGIEKTLGKPHGLNNIMNEIIKFVQKNPTKFDTIVKRLVNKCKRKDIEDALEILKNDGIIQIIYRNDNPRKGNYFSIQKVCIDPRAEEQLNKNNIDNINFKLEELRRNILNIVGNSRHHLVKHLEKCMQEGILTDKVDNIIVKAKAWITFKSVSMTLAHSVVLQEQGVYKTLREISVQIWGNSKVLDRYKKEISMVSGESLTKLHLSIMPESTYFYGNITGELHGKKLLGICGYPVVITDDTIKSLNIIEANIKGIFIIENSAVFISLLKRKYYKESSILIMFGEGYLSYSKRRFLKKILKYKQVPVYVWSDLDEDGLDLTLDIIKYVRSIGAECSPVLMSKKELSMTKGSFKGARHIDLEKEEFRNEFPDVVDMIKEGIVMEQEELLLYYGKIEGKLP